MSKFSQIDQLSTPMRVVVLRPDAFADTWEDKPTTEVAIGLRRVSESEIQTAKGEAASKAYEYYANDAGKIVDGAAFDEAYNDAVIAHLVARGTCDPNDVRKPYFEHAEDVVCDALTSDGMRRIWDELILLHLMSSANLRAADDDEIQEFAATIEGGSVSRLAAGEQAEVRKLIAHCMDRLESLEDTRAPDVYVARTA